MQSLLSQLGRSSRRFSLRSYAMALVWTVIADTIMYLGDRYLARTSFPWALLSLLLVAGVADIYGTGPSVLVLVLSALFADLIVPDLHISYFQSGVSLWSTSPIRVLLFAACGATIILLAHQARAMREDAERRRAVVQALQSMVLPEVLVAPDGYAVAGAYKPAKIDEDVGGDFYDFFPIAADRGLWGMLMGDVLGKGKEAAAFTGLLRYTIRAYAHAELEPGTILAKLGALVEAQKSKLATASVFFAVLETQSGELCYANAGHEPPILMHPNGVSEELTPTGPIIGATSQATYESKSLVLEKGDTLFLFTDGLTEARNDRGEFLDTAGAVRLLRQALRANDASEAVVAIEVGLSDFTGGRQRDDLALMLLRRCRS